MKVILISGTNNTHARVPFLMNYIPTIHLRPNFSYLSARLDVPGCSLNPESKPAINPGTTSSVLSTLVVC